MNKNIVWVKINSSKYYKIVFKLSEFGITIYDLKKEKKHLLIKTTYQDYLLVKKYLISYKVELWDSSGYNKIVEIIKKYSVFVISVIIGLFIILIINNVVFKIEVKTNNKDIQKLVLDNLEKYNLKVMRFKKSHSEIEEIVKKILDDNEDYLEWLEIKYDGLIMIVNITEKSQVYHYDEGIYCDVYAKKDSKIISFNVERGNSLKEINDYVHKGELLISGDITLNDEIKNKVCAKGEIFGEVWYRVNIKMPLVIKSEEYTGKNRYNINFKSNSYDYDLFKSRLDKKRKEYINIFRLNDFEINILKEKEYKNKYIKLNEKEAYEKALNKVIDNIKINLHKNEEILLQKVLKKDVNDSTIYLSVFVITKESIGVIIKKEV